MYNPNSGVFKLHKFVIIMFHEYAFPIKINKVSK